jgi:hypothetical protein
MNYDLCNPGTFNSKEAQPMCNPCPVGEFAVSIIFVQLILLVDVQVKCAPAMDN